MGAICTRSSAVHVAPHPPLSRAYTHPQPAQQTLHSRRISTVHSASNDDLMMDRTSSMRSLHDRSASGRSLHSTRPSFVLPAPIVIPNTTVEFKDPNNNSVTDSVSAVSSKRSHVSSNPVVDSDTLENIQDSPQSPANWSNQPTLSRSGSQSDGSTRGSKYIVRPRPRLLPPIPEQSPAPVTITQPEETPTEAVPQRATLEHSDSTLSINSSTLNSPFVDQLSPMVSPHTSAPSKSPVGALKPILRQPTTSGDNEYITRLQKMTHKRTHSRTSSKVQFDRVLSAVHFDSAEPTRDIQKSPTVFEPSETVALS